MTTTQFVTLMATMVIGFLTTIVSVCFTVILYLTGRIDRSADSLKELWRAEMAAFKLEIKAEVKELPEGAK